MKPKYITFSAMFMALSMYQHIQTSSTSKPYAPPHQRLALHVKSITFPGSLDNPLFALLTGPATVIRPGSPLDSITNVTLEKPRIAIIQDETTFCFTTSCDKAPAVQEIVAPGLTTIHPDMEVIITTAPYMGSDGRMLLANVPTLLVKYPHQEAIPFPYLIVKNPSQSQTCGILPYPRADVS